jgi:gliding motility-associated-like protein
VPNGKFEGKLHCPDSPGQLNLVDFWFCPQYNCSVDYYTRCSLNPDFSIPTNFIGFQQPLSDSSYIGAALYSESNSREYFGIKLTHKLKNQSNYVLKLNLNLSDNFKHCISKNDIGVYFSSDSITMPQSHGFEPLPYSPQVVAGGSTEMLNDTANWTKLTFYYQAQGDEEYIYIGNFNDNNNTTFQIFNVNGSVNGAYYCFDDISLVEIFALDPAFKRIKKRDSCYTTKDTLWVKLENTGVDSLDFDQAPLPYLVEIRKNGNVVQSFMDSIQTNQYNPAALPLPLDSSIWFPVAPVDLSDLDENYNLSVELQWPLDENSANNQIDTTFNTNLSFGLAEVSEDTVCFGDEVQLTTANYKGAIQWQSSLDETQWQNLMPGDTLQESPTQKTFYRLAVCETLYSDTFEVEVIKPNLTALEEFQFCSEEQTIKIEKESTFSTLRWYTNKNNSHYLYEGISLDTTLKSSTTFYLAPVLLACESKERIPLKVTISCEIKIPNVFTPNGDGINDLFVYRNVDEKKELQTKIFNRWGEKVAEWSGNKGWKGDGESEGIYYYEIYYGEETMTGVVSLIRD